MNHDFIILYKNVCLRQVFDSDLEELRQWRNNDTNCMYLRKIPTISREQQLNWYSNYLKNKDEIIFAIVETRLINKLVGSLSLYNFSLCCVEFGKFLIGEESAHGKKVGLNAMFAALNFAFTNFQIKFIYLNVFKDNISAIKVYEKVGFESANYINDKEIRMELTKERFYEVFRNEKC